MMSALSARSPKQRSVGRHVAPLVILIQSQRVFVLAPSCGVPIRESANTSFLLFSLN
jgi:hypothetical protein